MRINYFILLWSHGLGASKTVGILDFPKIMRDEIESFGYSEELTAIYYNFVSHRVSASFGWPFLIENIW